MMTHNLNKTKANNKVILIGLDGATFDLLRPLAEEGQMPNLKKILRMGVYGELESTIPPYTATAWTSMATGKNPGKHGIFHFLVRSEDFSHKVYLNNTLIKARKIWNILSDEDKKVGIINFPISYPTEKVNGFMVSGFLTPKSAKDITYPKELLEKIINHVGDHVIYVPLPISNNLTEKESIDLTKKINNQILKRREMLDYLMDNHESDFLMAVFMGLDQIQHKFWKYLDKEESSFYNSEEGKKLRPLLMENYYCIDNMLGDIVRDVDDKTSIFIISDHGFGSFKKEFYLNRWLSDMGLLKYDKKRLLLNKVVYKRLGILRRSGFPELWGGVIPDSFQDGYIDWSKTKAYCGHSSEQAIYINLKGRDKNGVVEPGTEYEELIDLIKEELPRIIDNETGEKIVDKVYKPKNIYSGPYVKNTSDLFVVPKDYSYAISPFISLRRKGYLAKISSPAGYHRKNGIFIALGNNIKRSKTIYNTSILDITPTILYLMGIPIPDDMDGKVVTDIFEDEFLDNNQIRFTDAKSNDSLNEDIYTEKEKDEIQDSLKGLGYL